MKLSQDSLRTLAEETGGFAAVNQNTLGSAFDRIVDANSRYYVLGYYPPTHGARWPVPSHRGAREAARAARLGAPRICLAARPHAGRAKARGGSAPGARRRSAAPPTTPRRSFAMRSTRRCSRAASPSPCRRRRSGSSRRKPRSRWRSSSTASRLQFAPQDSGGLFANTLEVSFFGINQDGARAADDAFGIQPDAAAGVAHARQDGRAAPQPADDARARAAIRFASARAKASAARSARCSTTWQVPDFRKEPLMLSGLLLTATSAQAAMTAHARSSGAEAAPGPADEPPDVLAKRYA